MPTEEPPRGAPGSRLREIGSVRQDSERGQRRWFQDDYFDLFVWQDERGAPIGFQLCYERSLGERALSWRAEHGFEHSQVDAGRRTGADYAMAPLLRPAADPPYFRIYTRFLEAAEALDPALRAFLLERLRDYRTVLFGVPRKPRRRRQG